MIKSLKHLEKCDLKNMKGEKLEYCLAHIIATLIILDKKVDGILKGLGVDNLF